MGETRQVRRLDSDAGNMKFIFRGGPQDGLAKESRRVIRAILTVVEENTNYEHLDPLQKKMVRSVVLDSINGMKRVALLYIEAQGGE